MSNGELGLTMNIQGMHIELEERTEEELIQSLTE
jgi:hypothetical protein